ncbi:MAG: hypothetical protein IPL59_14040 [Candidatus Competibacteraceae bacterium]|uniref:CopG family transcriptional regulator n=1 Tax=Candidatus Contendobacter odensis Run_B_J11 TaxID=1400861 RepID=A0A7U7J4R9_9GAMM|nr:hypothetical protein [Candidatus Contendobacter odensis]MBK8536143.1 hypothetical protein [Candidatus Competibacteraceae bacterium]CDH45600.1 hypothetical protein BN874_2670006 [Candidatus Contendobacter odensis Run_B_J11]
MMLSIQLPVTLEQKLSAYCAAHYLTEDEAILEALNRLLTHDMTPTPYELGQDGFGADRVHRGEIASESKRLLRMKFRGPAVG